MSSSKFNEIGISKTTSSTLLLTGNSDFSCCFQWLSTRLDNDTIRACIHLLRKHNLQITLTHNALWRTELDRLAVFEPWVGHRVGTVYESLKDDAGTSFQIDIFGFGEKVEIFGWRSIVCCSREQNTCYQNLKCKQFLMKFSIRIGRGAPRCQPRDPEP